MAPTPSSKLGSFRSRSSRPNTLASTFKEDSIVAFRYENTVAAAPPIPVGPTKTPTPSSRPPSSASSALPSAFSNAGSPPQSPPSSIPPSPSLTTSFSAGPSSPRNTRLLTRASSDSACSTPTRASSRPPSSVSTLRRNPSTIAAAVAASRNAPPPPPVEHHPLFRDNVSVPFSFSVPTVSELPSKDFNQLPRFSKATFGISQSNNTRSASTSASSSDRSDFFWRRGSSVAGTASSASTIGEVSIGEEEEEHSACPVPIGIQKRPSKKRQHALVSTSLPRTPEPLNTSFHIAGVNSAPVSPSEPHSPFGGPVSGTVPNSPVAPSDSVFGSLPCVTLQRFNKVHQKKADDTAAMPPPSYYKSLDAAANSIIVDSRLSVDFRPMAGHPTTIPEHVVAAIRPGASSPAFSEASSYYSNAPSHTVSSAFGEAAEKRIKLGKAFSIRTVSGVKNRFRRRSPTVPTSATPIRKHDSAMTSVTSSVGRFSLSAPRPPTGTGSSTADSPSTSAITPTQSSFLGASRLSLLIGGSRSRPQTEQALPPQLLSDSSSMGIKSQQSQTTDIMPASQPSKHGIMHGSVLGAEQGFTPGVTSCSKSATDATASHTSGEMMHLETAGTTAGDPCNDGRHLARVREPTTSAIGAPSASGSTSIGARQGPAARAQSQFQSKQAKVQAQSEFLSQQNSQPSQEQSSLSPKPSSSPFSSSFVSAFGNTRSAPSSSISSEATSPTSRSTQPPVAFSYKKPSLLPFATTAADRPSPHFTHFTHFTSSPLPAATPASSFSTSLFSTTTTTVHHTSPLSLLSSHRKSYATSNRSSHQAQSQQPPQTLPASASSSSRPQSSSSRAHHVSLPPSASKNLFSIDFGNFSVDDLALITDFESRPVPDLRLSEDFTAAPVPVNTSSIPSPLVAPRPQPQARTVGPFKSRFSLPESIWPRPLIKTPTLENDTHLPLKIVKPQAPTDAAHSQSQERSSAEQLHLPLAIDILSESLVDDDFLTGFQFSKRGSVILGGNRVISRSALEKYLRSTSQQPTYTDNTLAEAVLQTTESANTQPTATTAGTSTIDIDSIIDIRTDSRAASVIISDCSSSVSIIISTPVWEGPPLIRKISPTPSPSLASLLPQRLPREPTYDFFDILQEQLGEYADDEKTLNDNTTVSASSSSPELTSNQINTQEPNLDLSNTDQTSAIMSSSPTDLLQPVLPDLEKESHKVRSLYESGETICWEDGAPTNAIAIGVSTGGASISSERLEPMPEAPEEADNSLVTPVSSHLAPAWTTPRSISSSLSQGRDSSCAKREFELAGGLEDWQDVHSRDVDRYGFINPKSSDSRLSTPTEVRQQQMQSGRSRRVLSKKDTFGNSLHSHSYLGRKMSARSLNTQASEVSAISWRSTRSVARQAANMLPGNRERRWMDDAGDMLTLAPGISDISDDVEAGRISESLKRKEWQRIEKWRRMAVIENIGVPGQGQQYEFNMKDPKLIERTWKGIPDCWRAAAWYSFLAQSARESGTAPTEESIISSFHALQTKPSIDDVQIDLDVPRTISRHIMFRRRYRGGQRLLFRVLHAIGLYFPEVGYVQGMASLAATLLSYFDEEKAFVMLVRLWTLRGLARLYSPGFEGLMDSLRELEGVWLAGKPVAKKMTELCIDPTAYGTRWYLTLFNLSIPFGAQLRIWDIFMLLGAPAVEGPLPPPPSATTSILPSAAPRRSAINLIPHTPRSKTSPPGTSSSAQLPPSRMGTALSTLSGPVPSDGLQVLHAAAAALIQALGEVIIDSDFENAMKALTSWIPLKDEDMLMRVTMAEYKTHYLNRKKWRLL